MKYPDIFNPDLSRIGVRESQMYNILAGQAMAETVYTSLGPRGMEKVYIDILGEHTVTKHGGAFLRKIDVDHPAAKIVAEAVNAVDTNVGDGTVSTAVLIGSMLRHSRDLMDLGLPTAPIVSGFEAAMEIALDALDQVEVKSYRDDRMLLNALVDSCLSGKAISNVSLDCSAVRDMVVKAVRCVADRTGRVDVDDIKIEEKQGNSVDMQMVMGTVIDKPIDSPAMPLAVNDAKVLLLNDSLDKERTKTESEISITSPEQMSAFLIREDRDILATAKKIAASGAKLVVSRKGIGPLAQEFLSKAGIASVRRAKYNDLWWLEKSTGAKVCEDVEGISTAELGFASRVYERQVGGDKMLFVESEHPGSVTILLRSNTKTHLDEFHRTIKNALFVARNFIEDPSVVFGGGSCEAAMACHVRDASLAVHGREQLAVERFAAALEEIPMTLARNVGMDTLDALPLLRSKHARNGTHWYGINSATRSIADMSKEGVVDASAVKRQMIKSAVEAACMILRVDDVFVKDLIDNTHCHIDGTVHAHKDPGKNHNHWEQEGLEQRQMHHHY